MPDEKKEDKSSGNLAVDLGKAVLASPLAEELRQPAREIGRGTSSLGMLINAFLNPGRLWALKRNLAFENAEALLKLDADVELRLAMAERLRPLAVHVEEIPEEYRQLPSPREGNDILEGFLLTDDSEGELREMYARLLASAMDNRQEKVHPSFAKIIGELTPAEAVLFKECVDCGGRLSLSDYLRGEGATTSQPDRIPEKDQPAVIAQFHSLSRQEIIVIKRVLDVWGTKFHNVVEVTPFGARFYVSVCGELPQKGLWHPDARFHQKRDDPPIFSEEILVRMMGSRGHF